MVETSGTCALTTARLKKRLKIIKQQMMMSRQYPDHQKKLRQSAIALQSRLDELTKTAPKGDALCPLNDKRVEEYTEPFSPSRGRRTFAGL